MVTNLLLVAAGIYLLIGLVRAGIAIAVVFQSYELTATNACVRVALTVLIVIYLLVIVTLLWPIILRGRNFWPKRKGLR